MLLDVVSVLADDIAIRARVRQGLSSGVSPGNEGTPTCSGGVMAPFAEAPQARLQDAGYGVSRGIDLAQRKPMLRVPLPLPLP